MSDPSVVYDTIREEIGHVLIGNETAIEQLLIALLSKGHVLMEGVPGVAKTTIARLFAQATGLEYARLQMTPDTLPADITGTTIYRKQTGEFEVQKGPVFANIVVADEINRATPKTQSALLEAMAEHNVTIEGETHELPDPFLVIATQNPIEGEGTFELPKAQRDRFQAKITIDLPSRTEERELLDRFDDDPQLGPDQVSDVVTLSDLRDARAVAADVHTSDALKRYTLDIVRQLRAQTAVTHGVSPRGTIMLLNAAKVRAAINEREYVIPGDVQAVSDAVLTHRIVLSTDAELSETTREEILAGVLDSVEAPSASPPSQTESTDAVISWGDDTTSEDQSGTDEQ